LIVPCVRRKQIKQHWLCLMILRTLNNLFVRLFTIVLSVLIIVNINIYFCRYKNFVKRWFCGFIKWFQNGLNGTSRINMGYMRIYARWVEIVFLLNIPIFFLPQPRPVDGPQLAWEQSAVKPLSDRYRPRASRSPRLSNARSRCPRFFLCARLLVHIFVVRVLLGHHTTNPISSDEYY
jgi:hypothetical protein